MKINPKYRKAMVVANAGVQYHGRLSLRITESGDASRGRIIQLAFPGLNNGVNGGKGGTVSFPEVGEEVLVAFNEGDFRRPVIIGELWSGDDRDPPPDRSRKKI